MLCLDCTFGVLAEVSSVTRFCFCLYLHCAVMFTVLFGVSSGGQSFRLNSIKYDRQRVNINTRICLLDIPNLTFIGPCSVRIF
jgi:hypothetical protein